MLKKVAAINDMSGIGKCSLTVAIPILSALKTQCCPYPTAILSSQTGYPKFTYLDFTSHMQEYNRAWKELDVSFDTIYSGFLGSIDQIDIVRDFIKSNNNAYVIVDPVMGDGGNYYQTFNDEICNKIKDLVKVSDLVTPNLTEACLLTNNKYHTNYTLEDTLKLAKEIANLGPKKVIITGILIDDNIINLGYDKESDESFSYSLKYNNKSYSGTGDIFTSIISGLITNGYDFKESIKIASDFIFKCISYTGKYDTDPNDGVFFEIFLNDLTSLNN